MCMYMSVCRYLRRPEEGARFHGARIIGGCKLPYVGAGN